MNSSSEWNITWRHVNSHERSWTVMNSHEQSWTVMNTHEDSWIHMNTHEFSWMIMLFVFLLTWSSWGDSSFRIIAHPYRKLWWQLYPENTRPLHCDVQFVSVWLISVLMQCNLVPNKWTRWDLIKSLTFNKLQSQHFGLQEHGCLLNNSDDADEE